MYQTISDFTRQQAPSAYNHSPLVVEPTSFSMSLTSQSRAKERLCNDLLAEFWDDSQTYIAVSKIKVRSCPVSFRNNQCVTAFQQSHIPSCDVLCPQSLLYHFERLEDSLAQEFPTTVSEAESVPGHPRSRGQET